MTQPAQARTGIGAVIGGLVGFTFGGPLGAGIGALIGGGVAHASKPKGEMTAKRQVIFARAMERVQDPADLNALAATFAGEGLTTEAAMLRKRASLRSLPKDKKENRKAAFRKAMASDDADTVAGVASAFAGEGAIDAAKTLRTHADAVRAAHAAGKSTKPMSGGDIQAFADKLGKAIVHFGAGTPQARTAAANLLRAQGKAPSPELVVEVIRVASEALQVEAPPAQEGAPPVEIDMDPAKAARAAEAAVPGAMGSDPPEPTVIGPPAARTEPEVVAEGVAIAGEDDGVKRVEAAGAMEAAE